MRSLVPREGFHDLRVEMDRLLERLMGEEQRNIGAFSEWKPPFDLKETKDQIIVTAEIPGVDPKDLHVEVRDDRLILEGQKKHEEEREDERFHRVERSYGAFSRAVMLPSPVDSTKGSALFRNGVIVITLPKAPAAKQNTILVKSE